ncbi:MAG: polyribonucleotide nucleotidyltransferase [bacterium]|nr:polyribonucleotide nucleotidyltransferase [bacterium]MDT8395503.1 polyribonucleotide nucleotidyltransferase [bacterium]
MKSQVQLEWGGRTITLETGAVARQASGSVWARYADTVVLATVVAMPEPREGVDFLPLTVNYQEKTYAAGKIPGGFFKREGRPTEKDTLASRLIDRSIRPLFPQGFSHETQVIINILSVDKENDADIVSLVASSAALMVSDVPFDRTVGAVRVGLVDGEYILNPTFTQLENSTMDLIVAGTREAVMMVEGEAKEISEDEMLGALEFAHTHIIEIIDLQNQLRSAAGKEKWNFAAAAVDESLVRTVQDACRDKIAEALRIADKKERKSQIKGIREKVMEPYAAAENGGAAAGEVADILRSLEKDLMRSMVLEENRRIDGRSPDQVRPITCEVGVLPRAHGSALFTRGETQALAVTTLGTKDDEQIMDSLEKDYRRKFMLHYNFPPFSTGEAKFLRGPARREIGHGNLAQRSLMSTLPGREDFPYTIRIVSEVLESNGSSSMATVCGGSLSLMDAGVPVKKAVAGIAMGLIYTPAKSVVLSDILGAEDHLGDMDFKVAGTRDGITAFQMDLKVAGISRELMARALNQARDGREHILGEMDKALKTHRESISPHAPRIITIHVKPDKIREIIGPGGKVIRSIVEQTGVKIEVEDNGTVLIASVDEEAAQRAIAMIQAIVEEPEIGRIYRGTVKKVLDFGAFVEIVSGTDGLVHISQLAEHRVAKVEDVVKEGDVVNVKVLDIDRDGKIRLSMKEAERELGTGGKPDPR